MIHEAQITYTVLGDKGEDKTVKENYVLGDAANFTDAENTLFEKFCGRSDLDVVSVKRSRIKEIANGRTKQEDVLWLAELQDTFMDDNGKEKHTRYKVLFYSTTFDMAKAYIAEYLTQGYGLELVSLKLTTFIDVIE